MKMLPAPIAAGIAALLLAGPWLARGAAAADTDRLLAGFERASAMIETSRSCVLLDIWIALTPEQRAQGLMFVHDLGEHQGMLFPGRERAVLRMWMKNTYIPLDMIWIGEDLRVVGVTENARPLTLDLRGIDAPSLYVLEVNAHFARRHGITPDWTVELRDVGRNVVP